MEVSKLLINDIYIFERHYISDDGVKMTCTMNQFDGKYKYVGIRRGKYKDRNGFYSYRTMYCFKPIELFDTFIKKGSKWYKRYIRFTYNNIENDLNFKSDLKGKLECILS